MPQKKSWFCCDPEKPHVIHLSTSERTVYFTDEAFRDELDAVAESRGLTMKEAVIEAVRDYLAQRRAASAWAALMPVALPPGAADRLKG